MFDLYILLAKHPECLGSGEKLKSYLSDFYPEIRDKKRIKAIDYRKIKIKGEVV